MSVPARAPMSVEQLAWELNEIRGAVIQHARHAFPALAREDLEDCYGKATEEALAGSFACRAELAAFMHVAVRHAAIDIKRSARWSRTAPLQDDVARTLVGGEDPAEVVDSEHHRDLLREFSPNWTARTGGSRSCTSIPTMNGRCGRSPVRLISPAPRSTAA